MKNTVETIQEIVTQLNKLNKIKKDKEYIAAGLTVGLTVGYQKDNYQYDIENLSLGVYSGIEEELINLLIKGLESRLSEWTKILEKESKEITNLLNELKK